MILFQSDEDKDCCMCCSCCTEDQVCCSSDDSYIYFSIIVTLKFFIAITNQVLEIIVCFLIGNYFSIDTLPLLAYVLLAFLILNFILQLSICLSLLLQTDVTVIQKRTSFKLTSTTFYSLPGLCLFVANPVITPGFLFGDSISGITFALLQDVLMIVLLSIQAIQKDLLDPLEISCLILTVCNFFRLLCQISEVNQARYKLNHQCEKTKIIHKPNKK
jgi:hypothetical protein